MGNHGLLFDTLIFLLATVVFVPIAKKFGLGSVLGYLLAGVVIGPWGLSIIVNAQVILNFAEFGVVLLLFLIGLELNPNRLWTMRRSILGMGGVQVIATSVVLTAIALAFGLYWKSAVVIALGLSLSSTAIVLQILIEKNLLSSPAGNNGFSILLFQDIAVIPMMALIPLLSSGQAEISTQEPVIAALKVVAAVIGIVLGGRYLIRPIFRLIAGSRIPEVFTAFSLLLVIGIALLMQAVDMSMALGTFLAGVLLAESEYRHQLESDIEPFKGLLLGLFFISVGMSIDFGLLLQRPGLILGLVLGLIVVKMIVLFILGRVYKNPPGQNYFFSFVLSQGGEFAFVLFSIASSYSILTAETTSIMVATVALSMMTTPLLMIINEKWIAPRFVTLSTEPAADVFDEDNPVIIAGFGRVGQIVARLLHANKIPTTVIDHSPEHIERVRKFGFKIFYGDASRLDLLHAAGLEKAKLLIIAIDDRQATNLTASLVKQNFPHVTILARAWDMIHAYELLDLGVNIFERETFESALNLGEQALKEIGFNAYYAKRAALKFRRYDYQTLNEMYEIHKDEEQFINRSLKAREELEKLFEADAIELEKKSESGWG